MYPTSSNAVMSQESFFFLKCNKKKIVWRDLYAHLSIHTHSEAYLQTKFTCSLFSLKMMAGHILFFPQNDGWFISLFSPVFCLFVILYLCTAKGLKTSCNLGWTFSKEKLLVQLRLNFFKENFENSFKENSSWWLRG